MPGVGISAAFDAFIGPGSGADGMTFTLADASVTQPTALGVNGGGEGFSGINGIAVSLDTWQNTADPSSNFVGIATTSSPTQSLNYVTTNSSIPSLINTVHHFVVTTTSTGITVTMDGTQVLNYATSLPPSVLVGFTGATGGFNDIHQVQNVVHHRRSAAARAHRHRREPHVGAEHGRDHGHDHRHELHRRDGRELRRHPGDDLHRQQRHLHHRHRPGRHAGTVDVTVTDGAGHERHQRERPVHLLADRRRPRYRRQPDRRARAPGGTSVTITGTNFTGAGGRELRRATRPRRSPSNNATTITATAPPGTARSTSPSPPQAARAPRAPTDQFTYVAGPPPPPTVTSVDPMSGPAGTLVTRERHRTSPARRAVDFGANPATFTVNNSTTITATAPAGTGTVDVTVTTGHGHRARTSADDQFTYTAGPPPGLDPVAGGGGMAAQRRGRSSSPPRRPPNLQVTPATNWLAGSAFWPTPVPGRRHLGRVRRLHRSELGRRRDDLHARRRECHPAHRAGQQRRR